MVGEEIDSRRAQELLASVDKARQAMRPALSPMWITYAMMCTASAAYPLMAYSFQHAPLPIWVPPVLLGVSLVAAVLFMGAALALMIRSGEKSVRGFGKRWRVMMMLWTFCYTGTMSFIVPTNPENANLGLLFGLACVFIVLAIVGPMWELIAQERERRALTTPKK